MADDKRPIPYEEYCHDISHSEWTQLMIHFYRGEMTRATTWRQRLDTTTNWAIAATAAIITFTLGNASAPPETFLLAVALTFIMLHIEARRYMYYDIWRSRLRMIERGFIAPALWRETTSTELENEDHWRRLLAQDLQAAHFHMPRYEAWGRRLRRNYIWLFLLIYGAWLLKLEVWPTTAHSFSQLVSHAGAMHLPGWIVMLLATLAMGLLLVLGVVTTHRRHARGEARAYDAARDGERWGLFDNPHR
jgi:uncharacterized membrane protein